MHLLKGRRQKQSNSWIKPVWYLFATIMILSLPTFSYLVPEVGRELIPSSGPAVGSAELGSQPEPAALAPSFRTTFSDSPARVAERRSQAAATARPRDGRSTLDSPRLFTTGNGVNRSARGWAGEGSGVAPRGIGRLKSHLQRSNTVPVRSRQRQAFGAEIEDGYEMALMSLLDSNEAVSPGLGHNPFYGALERRQNPPSGGSQGSSSNPSGEEKVSQGSTPENPAPVGEGQASQDSGADASASRHEFLLVGYFDDSQPSRRLFRGERAGQGDFLLENNHRLSLFSGVFAVPRPQVTLPSGERLLTGDLNGDGLSDVVRLLSDRHGTLLETFVRKGSQFELQADMFLLYRSVEAAAVFDSNRDGRPELVLVVSGNPNLVFYELIGDELRYVRELALPFAPAMLVDISLPGSVRESRLLVLDQSLTRASYISSRFSGSYLFPWDPAVIQRNSFLIKSPEGRGESRVRSLEIENRVVLYTRNQHGIRLLASVDVSRKATVLILGDYAGNGSWQLVYMP